MNAHHGHPAYTGTPMTNPLNSIVIADAGDLYVALIQNAGIPAGAFEVRPFRGELVVVRANTDGRDLADWAGAIKTGVSSASADFRLLVHGVRKVLAGQSWI
jgi:hypothetical protein